MSPHEATHQDAAHAFLQRNQSQHLSHDSEQLLQRCRDHLMETLGITERTAESIALRAWGEISCKDEPGYIDLQRSTSRLVMVHDPRFARSQVFTVAELVASRRPPDQPAG